MNDKYLLFTIVASLFFLNSFGQQIENDSLDYQIMEEVIVIGNKKEPHCKPLASLENYLSQSENVSLVKRGAYASEPILNNMSTERTSITIDGMHMFYACTDKMDPITSYVEINNLAKVHISSGQQGSQNGATIGGAIDLRKKCGTFTHKRLWNLGLQSGYESNNQQKINGGKINYSSPLLYVDANVLHRDASNYKAGGNKEILYSQYKKLNLSSTVGIALGEDQSIEAYVIYDKATDVGYPALPMDVSLAEALITSLKHEISFKNSAFKHWETKLYFNNIVHKMDDSKRPDVPIRMDMPGWSKTYGMYSKIYASMEKHEISAQINAYHNNSLAEMTMYPDNPNEPSMYMYTWPDVNTFYAGFSLKDIYALDDSQSIQFSWTFGSHNNSVKNQSALSSLQIFYPELTSSKNRILNNFALNYNKVNTHWDFGFGLAYGFRAPSVSEAYGFYLFNSADKYDYIGNPYLKNENSIEGNTYIKYTDNNWKSKLSASFFHIGNYIIGKPVENYSSMTIDAEGVKRYIALDYAQMMSVDWMLAYNFNSNWNWSGNLGYYYGKDKDSNILPYISPLKYKSRIDYKNNPINASLYVEGNALKNKFAASYGEKRTEAYAILNASFGYTLNIGKQSLNINCVAENIFDTNYTTYSDWNQIPRLGRNISFSVVYEM